MVDFNQLNRIIETTGLPIVSSADAIRKRFNEAFVLLLQAEPGAGKSTILPLILLSQIDPNKKIIMLEPRRVAAKSTAQRMAQLLQQPLGETVGYRVKNDSCVGRNTQIEIVTDGVFTRIIQNDPTLNNYHTVIFDEFHERSLFADLGLAFAQQSQEIFRPDLKLVIMSATLQIEALHQQFKNAQMLSISGNCFPVTVYYQIVSDRRAWLDCLIATTLQEYRQTVGDVLIFLPGKYEIVTAEKQLMETLKNQHDVSVLTLYGEMPLSQQQRVLLPTAGIKKIILSTNLAETSLTIEGVTLVIDSGWFKQNEFDPNTGFERLVMRRISESSARQRTGRAGRTQSGRCIRMWPESERLRDQTEPQILHVDLASLTLELAHWGASDLTDLCLLDYPPAAAMAQAKQLLRWLDALNVNGTITAHGQLMCSLNLHPRLAHMLIRSVEYKAERLACLLAAMLEERDFVDGDKKNDPDIEWRIDQLLAIQSRPKQANNRARSIFKHADELLKKLSTMAIREKTNENSEMISIGGLLSLAFPERIGQLRNADYRLANGRGASFHNDYPIKTPWLVVPTLSLGDKNARIYRYAAISKEELYRLHEPHFTREIIQQWQESSRIVRWVEQTRFDALVVQQRIIESPSQPQIKQALLHRIREVGLAQLPWTDELHQWQKKILMLTRLDGFKFQLPDVSDDFLLQHLDRWLAPFFEGVHSLKQFGSNDLKIALNSLLTWEQQKKLQNWMPETITVPSGSNKQINYLAGAKPVLSVKLQEMFGLNQSPKLAQGLIPLQIHLLSPSGQPLQITDDLSNFWRHTYFEVRREMKGRYPKHPWPEDPTTFQATRLTSKQLLRQSKDSKS